MRYKAEYKPSELRCPVTGAWVPVEECRAALDARRGGFGPSRAAPEAGFPREAPRSKGNSKSRLRRKNGGSEGEDRGSEGESGGSEDSYDVLVGVVSSGGLRYVGVLPEAPEELRGLQPLLREKHDAFRKATGARGRGSCASWTPIGFRPRRVGIERPGDERERERRGRWGGESGGRERERVTSWRTNTRDAFGDSRKTTLFRSCRRSWRKTRRDIGRRHGSTIPGSGVSAGSGLTLDATSASGSTPGSDVSLGSRLISGSAAGAQVEGGADHPTGRRPSLATVLAVSSLPPVFADLGAPALLALARTLPCSQMLEPRTPCTCFCCLPCSQMFPPRTPCTGFAPSRARRSESPRTPCTCFAPSRARKCSSPALLALTSLPPCSQMAEPPHSLHWLRCLPCSQMAELPAPSHWVRCLPCSQMLEPAPLHWLRTLPCSQI